MKKLICWRTLLDRTSGGGACVVQPLSTAGGSNFQISGAQQLAFLKNRAFYDRPALVEYIPPSNREVKPCSTAFPRPPAIFCGACP